MAATKTTTLGEIRLDGLLDSFEDHYHAEIEDRTLYLVTSTELDDTEPDLRPVWQYVEQHSLELTGTHTFQSEYILGGQGLERVYEERT